MVEAERVSGTLFYFPSSNYIYSQPYGVCLVMDTWNYQILLALHPAVSAIAAGNTILLDGKYDHIFFTGSPRVSKIVMNAAASTTRWLIWANSIFPLVTRVGVVWVTATANPGSIPSPIKKVS